MPNKTHKTTKKDASLLEQFQLFYEAVPGIDYAAASGPNKASKNLKRTRK